MDIRKVGFYLLLLWATALSSFAQNLVSNPGFEEYTSCPERNGDIKKCVSWSTTSAASTPDYFHRCYRKGRVIGTEVGVPLNSEGYREPVSGDAYMGLAVFFKKNYYAREYIQNSLRAPLERGVKYKFSFYISLSDSSEFCSDHIAVEFSLMPNGITARAPEVLLTARHPVVIRNEEALRSHQWTKIEGEFIARGGEEYMIIGSFRPNMNEKEYRKRLKYPLLNCTNSECAAYYYVDEVFVEEMIVEKVNPRFK